MYIPKINLTTDNNEIIGFMKQFSFATIISSVENKPIATHLPFLVSADGDHVVLRSHFAKANDHWKEIEQHPVLVIFAEPHAYISPSHYDHLQNVPTWNYIAVHAYGEARLLQEEAASFEVLEATILQYEPGYKSQWDQLPADYKQKMVKGIVAFEIRITELQGKKKLSQNRSETEKQKIIEALSQSYDTNEQLIATYMKKM